MPERVGSRRAAEPAVMRFDDVNEYLSGMISAQSDSAQSDSAQT